MQEVHMKLAGKVAIVTGDGQGIGRQIALKLAGEGAAVVVNDLDDEKGRAMVAEIADAGGRAIACNGDVTADGFAEEIVGAGVDGLGGLHILVNNAGYIWNTAIHNHSDEQWDAMLDVHAKAPFRILRAAGRYFREQVKAERAAGLAVPCRKVVNVASVSGLYGAPTQISYSAGKMALIGMTNVLAKEWGRMNITVNAVAFGIIETRLTQAFDGEPETITVKGRDHKVGIERGARNAAVNMIPLNRIGTTEEAAGAVYLFCIPESDYISGETIVCSGGSR
jgi:3-oxoacyl-[acyl-carrier protein] reductase